MGKALLLSGGIDSVALAYWVRPSVAFTIDYGQIPAQAEIRASAQVCRELCIRHEVIRADCSSVGIGGLTQRAGVEISPTVEWWPYRNQLLITLAGTRMIALELYAYELLLGSVATDTDHKDGSSQFYSTVDALMSLQEGGVRIQAPALGLTSTELISISGISHGLLGWTHSCHRANIACGNCRGCWKHLRIFRQIGLLE